MSRRFFRHEPIRVSGEGVSEVVLDGDEAHHAARVMRVRVGDPLTLFDGSGWEFTAEVLAVERGRVRLAVRSSAEVDREARVEVAVGVALPKGDRQKVLVEKLTEVGVRRLTPLVTEHGVAQPKANGVERLRRAVIEASKQCGRNRLMQVDVPVPLDAYLATTQADQRLIAHPAVEPHPPERVAGSVAIAIGPEGGFSDEEVAAALSAGWGRLTLGGTILRVETAAIVAAARFTTT